MGNCFGAPSFQSDSNFYTPSSQSVSNTDQYIGEHNAGGNSRGSVDSRSRGHNTEEVEEATTTDIKETEKTDAEEPGYNVRVFTYSDLKAATRNFRPASFLGQGGFGSVYKGWIDEKTYKPVAPGLGRQIAVKLMNNEGLQGDKEWMTEVFYLSQLRHPHLVKLIGYCSERDHRLLAYEFMPNGSLEDHLFVGSSRQPLSWERRLKVAMGAARGLAFLHSLEPCVIYRDFKSSNILLDTDFNAKLSDFGLAKDGPTEGATHVTTRVMGTFGYAAPEYIATGHLTTKNDVYGFGVVLLEILTGRKAVDNRRRGEEQNLVQWAMPFLRNKSRVLRLIETRLDGQYSRRGALMLAHVALRCVNPSAKERPHMHQVVELLEPTVERSYKDMTLPQTLSPRTHDSAHRYQEQTLQSAQEALDGVHQTPANSRNT